MSDETAETDEKNRNIKIGISLVANNTFDHVIIYSGSNDEVVMRASSSTWALGAMRKMELYIEKNELASGPGDADE